jgi:preprotein translocase subunit SecA
MAGRGTDIVLGGKMSADADAAEKDAWQVRHNEAIKAGGLHIIGTERHESRRIDNQLRGRSGRQGDPGSTRFYLSLKDNLMRIFISDNISALLSKLGLRDGEALTHSLVTRAVENAQRKVEGHNFDVRKQLLEFDDVANDQRKVIYQQRNELLEVEDIQGVIQAIQEDVVNAIISEYMPPQSFEEQWDILGLMEVLERDFGLKLDIKGWLDHEKEVHEEVIRKRILAEFSKVHEAKEQEIGNAAMRHLEKSVMLSVLDSQWREHLAAMDYMRQSIHLRGYAQKDPKQEYKREAFTLFSDMLDSTKREVISVLTRVQFRSESDVEAIDQQWREHEPKQLQFTHADAPSVTAVPAELANAENIDPSEAGRATTYTRNNPKIGRNDACPCGSQKKYKQCHGRLA